MSACYYHCILAKKNLRQSAVRLGVAEDFMMHDHDPKHLEDRTIRLRS